jgi:hypothetical protein
LTLLLQRCYARLKPRLDSVDSRGIRFFTVSSTVCEFLAAKQRNSAPRAAKAE